MSYLQKRGNIWYVRLRIPKELLAHFWPQTEIRKSLQTSRLTHARKLAHKTLHELQQSFFEMRYATPMEQRPPSKLALEIFKKMYPHLSPDHAITYNVKGRAITTWPLELMSIQDALDEGYRPNEAGVLDFEHGTHQAPPAPQPVPAPQPATKPKTKERKKADPSVSSIVESYLKQDIHVKPKTLETKRHALAHFVRFSEGRSCREVITPSNLDTFLNEYLIQTSKLAIGTRKSHAKILKAFLRWGIKKGHVSREIMEDIADIRLVETQKDKFLKGVKPNKSYHDAQLQTLLTSFMNNPAVSCSTLARRLSHIRTIYYVLTAMFTGFRVQTLGQLKGDSFDFSAKVHTLTVLNRLETDEDGREFTTNKTGLSLRLPIVRQLESLHLKEFVSLKVHGDGPIFGPATVTLDQRVDAQLAAAGLKQDKQRMHALRGTVNNKYLLCSAVQPDMKEILMGHVDQKVSGAYDDFTFLMESKPEAIRGLMEKALVYNVDFVQIGNYLKKQMEWFSL